MSSGLLHPPPEIHQSLVMDPHLLHFSVTLYCYTFGTVTLHCDTVLHCITVTLHCPKLLTSLKADWLELLPPVLGVEGSNPAVSGVITEKVILAAGFFQSTLWHG